MIAVLVVVLITGVTLVIFAWNTRPQLIEFSPHDGAINIPATTPIRLVFSRSMQQEMVNEHIKIEPAIAGHFLWDDTSLTFTPEQPWPDGETISVTLEAGVRATSWISFPMGQRSWSFRTSSENLAYLWPADGKADLYALDPASGNIEQFTNGMGVLEYSVSRNGMVFYFSATNSKGGSNLFQINRAGEGNSAQDAFPAHELIDCGTAQCRSPVVSYDDQYLAYEYILPDVRDEATPTQIWMLSLSSLKATPVGRDGHETVQPGWSTTGLLAYYDRTSSAYEIYNPQTLERSLLPNQTGQPGAWSPDGRYYLAPEISYTSAAGGTETGSSYLMRYDVQGKTVENISGTGLIEDIEPVYSADGGLIALARKYLDAQNWSLGRQVWIMDADGTGAHRITDEADYNHYDLAWSRDGGRIAYVRFNQAVLANPPELWIVNADGSNPLQLVIGGYSPIWIP